MEVKMEHDLSYFEFLKLIHVIGINNRSIQRENASLIYKNYDLNRVKAYLDKEIEMLNKVLKN